MPATISAWTKSVMSKAGIDTTIFKPHSIRSASSTKAIETGIPMREVKDHAHWSHSSQTFEKFYYKPTAKQHNSTQIANSIFSQQGKPTTLESESKSTRIVLDTTNNASVDGDEDENVVTNPRK
ncbi:hypothetical protein [Parasitella parasitica]|uniref:Uncharacterized protein n=1 Tax=Parasitella parasitica TaxID=35722 RepID=A0A0B7NFF5_9FUNG|nr:hypothetical protein [Parasitella parasitica]